MIPTLIILCSMIGLTSGLGVLPDVLNAAVGGTVTFTTSLTPTETPFASIVWSFKGVPIVSHSFTDPLYKDRITLFPSTGSLELRNLALSDAGVYSVAIQPAGGKPESGETTLNIYEKIENASVQPSNPPVEGSSVNLTCDAAGPVLTREWMFNGMELKPSGNIDFYDENRVVSFRNLTRKDNGKYTCRISNPPSTQSVDYTMNVIYGPESVKISGPLYIDEGKTLTLNCSADCEPTPKYTWTKDGTTLEAQSSVYTKENITLSDRGEYVCLATNEVTMNKLDTSHTVNVTESPEVPESGLSPGAIAGITLASLVVVAGAAVGGFLLYKHKKDRKEKKKGQELEHVYENTSNTGNNITDVESKHVYENSDNIYERTL